MKAPLPKISPLLWAFLIFAALMIPISSGFAEDSKPIDERINDAMAPTTDFVESVIFYEIPVSDDFGIKWVLVWLGFAAVFFTMYFKFINLRSWGLMIRTVRGKYSTSTDPGQVTHFQALTAALSATVGLGNIAGVAIAVKMGGPGATFWMILMGLLGMTLKFVECTLGVKYREIDENGKVFGGPVQYLKKGFKERGLPEVGAILAVLFAFLCIGGSLGGGNMFQINSATEQLVSITSSDEHKAAKEELSTAKAELAAAAPADAVEGEAVAPADPTLTAAVDAAKEKADASAPFFGKHRWVFGLIIAIVVGVVIIGGITSIAKVTSKLVPLMCGIYLLGVLVVLFANFSQLPNAIGQIFSGAFNPDAVKGGIVGCMLLGIQRAVFSNEAGVGSAPFAHSAVRTKKPASEGIVALLEPFTDTVVVCTMTALAITITGTYQQDLEGVAITSAAFESVMPWFTIVLSVAVILFAFSTMISWSYYGQQSWAYLFGRSKGVDLAYKILFCAFIIIGASMTLGKVTAFSDAMIFAMCVPNVIGLYVLFPMVKTELEDFRQHAAKIDAGE